METKNQTKQASDNTFVMPSSFVFHEDAGHGWLAVPYQALVALNIQEKITGFSYRKDDMVYLEEDFDAPLFTKAYLRYNGRAESDYDWFGARNTLVYDGDYSFIRKYAHYYVTH